MLFIVAASATACASSRRGASERAAADRSVQQPAAAVPERPVFFEVEPPAAYRQAVQRGTRSTTGVPGPEYWQQRAEYDLAARIAPEGKRLEGEARIVYYNHSPDTLSALYLNLLQNFHAAGAVRVEFSEVTGGVDLARVAVGSTELEADPEADREGPGYQVIGTLLRIVPLTPVYPGASIELFVDYGFDIPEAGASGRMGWSRNNLLFLAYWYPQMAVYDDVIGWHTDQFLGNAEFYAGFADYDVTIEIPPGWLVRATGELQNPEETLAAAVLEWLRAGAASDSIVHVVTAADFGAGQTRPAEGSLSWHFQADSIHDFAFSATRESFFDVTRTPVGDRDGNGETDYTRIETLYRQSAPLWKEAARYAAQSIRELSRFTGLSYPWPHMTAVEGAGIIGGGMEFPMLTLIGDYNERGDIALYAVVAHELAHMWIPMVVSNNERRFAWMDEGTTSFNENQVHKDFHPPTDWDLPDQEDYLEVARADLEGEILRWSDYHYPGRAYRTASYTKPASVLAALRGVLGEEEFLAGYHAFFDRWAWKHPYPWDLFRTFEDVAGRDLDWFWHAWYYETWTLDQAVTEVTMGEQATTIVIEDRGKVPMPVHLQITRVDDSIETLTVPVDVWLQGARRTTVTMDRLPVITRVEIDPDRDFPDVDRSNNVWTR